MSAPNPSRRGGQGRRGSSFSLGRALSGGAPVPPRSPMPARRGSGSSATSLGLPGTDGSESPTRRGSGGSQSTLSDRGEKKSASASASEASDSEDDDEFAALDGLTDAADLAQQQADEQARSGGGQLRLALPKEKLMMIPLHARDKGASSAAEAMAGVTEDVFYELPIVGQSDDAVVSSWVNGMLRPLSFEKLIWDGMILLLLFYTLVAVPLEIVMDSNPSGLWFAWETLTDILFICDVMLNFRTGFMDDQGHEVFDKNKIASNYLGGWFWPDAISAVPFSLLIGAFERSAQADGSGLVKVTKGGRLAKALKGLRMTKLARVLKFAKVGEVLRDIEDSSTSSLHYVFWAAFKFIGGGGLTLHVMACVWYGIGMTNGPPGVPSWIELYEMELGENEMFGNKAKGYLASMYWVITVMTTVGFGDIVPVRHGERLFAMVAMLFGGVFYGFIVATSSQIFKSDAHVLKLLEKMEVVGSYMRQRHFPRALRNRIRRYYRRYFEERTAFDEVNILSELSPQLREEVSTFLVSDLVFKSPLFARTDATTLSHITMIMKPMFVEPGGYIITRGSEGRDFYILIAGEAIEFDQDDQACLRLVAGAAIGDDAGLGLATKYSQTVRAYSSCELYLISGKVLPNAIGKDAFAELCTSAKLRHAALAVEREIAASQSSARSNMSDGPDDILHHNMGRRGSNFMPGFLRKGAQVDTSGHGASTPGGSRYKDDDGPDGSSSSNPFPPPGGGSKTPPGGGLAVPTDVRSASAKGGMSSGIGSLMENERERRKSAVLGGITTNTGSSGSGNEALLVQRMTAVVRSELASFKRELRASSNRPTRHSLSPRSVGRNKAAKAPKSVSAEGTPEAAGRERVDSGGSGGPGRPRADSGRERAFSPERDLGDDVRRLEESVAGLQLSIVASERRIMEALLARP